MFQNEIPIKQDRKEFATYGLGHLSYNVIYPTFTL